MNTSSKPKARKGGKKNDNLYNILTVVFLVMSLCLGGAFVSIFLNPYSALNPFPPNTPIPTLVPPTITPLGLPPTWTPQPTTILTETPTPRPSITPLPSDTPFPTPTSLFTATATVPASRTPRPTGVPYNNTITYYESTAFLPASDCSWFGVAGQVLDANNNPVQGAILRLGGSVPGKTFFPALTTLSGIDAAYGPSGFQFELGIPPVDSRNSLYIQLFNQSDEPLSEQVFLQTYNDCKRNLVFVRFKQR